MESTKIYKNTELVNDDLATVKLPRLRDDFIAKLENALMFLSFKDLSMFHSEALSKVNLRQFDGAWLTDVSLRHEKEEGFTFAPFGDLQVTPEMFPRLNIKLMNMAGDIAHLSKYRFLEPKEKRHLKNYRYIYSEKFGFLDYGKQRWWTNENGFGFNKMEAGEDTSYIIPIPVSLMPGYFIKNIDILNELKEGIKNTDSPYFISLRNFHLALQLALTYDYEWSCYIRETPDSLGVRIPIHPSSSKEIFIMRNIPEGAKRRKAIVNFVKDHYRTVKNVKGEDTQILIKKHFRGELKFNWRGLEVHITPSSYDLRRIKTSKKFKNTTI
nr:hypothetical protein [uncultured Draconibacterium sp.]